MNDRADKVLVARGLTKSRTEAQELIRRGGVRVNGKEVGKASEPVDRDAEISIRNPLPFVSRGGLKLAFALAHFLLNPKGLVAADIGASTGGFTDCLLQQEARKVYAIDVGTNQLDPGIRENPRVVPLEQSDIRSVTLPEKVDLAVIDVSFISLEKVIPAAIGILKDSGKIIALVKPQFEVGRENIGKNGVVKNGRAKENALRKIMLLGESLGFKARSVPSPIFGKSGNEEYLVLLSR